MKNSVKLSTNPSVADALAWSEDGLVAIAADDQVVVLVNETHS